MKIEIYKDKRGEWRWRARHSNGNIVADSGEGYTRKASAVRAWRRFYEAVYRGPVIEVAPA